MAGPPASIILATTVLAWAGPAAAGQGTPLPEPSGLFLLGLGFAGVVLGRRFSRRKGGD